MQKRKSWSQEEDRVLKFLKEQRGEAKWSSIVRIMEAEFGLTGRTSKQCRQRYHNHLDSSIVTDSWTVEEENTLLRLHGEIGNKWSAIAQHLPGRTDNCIKNHFYSRLRKNLRRVKRVITEHSEQQCEVPQVREKVLSKIMEIQEGRFETDSKVDEEMAEFCNGIKNRLFEWEWREQEGDGALYEARRLAVDIQIFENNYKKGFKAIKRSEFQMEFSNFLRPPTLVAVRRRNSHQSSRSEESFLSSSSCISSCSDLSEYDQNDEQRNSRSTRSCRERKGSSGREDDFKEMKEAGGMQAGQFQREHLHLIQEEQDSKLNQQFEKQLFNISYENTPMMARILAPPEDNDLIEDELFPPPSDYIEYKEEEQV